MTAQSAGLVAKLETIARQLDWWIEFGERSFESEGKMFTDDMVHSPPELPSKGVLKAWIATINEAALLAALPHMQPAGEALAINDERRRLIAALQSARDRMVTAFTPKVGEAFDGDFDTMLDCVNFLKRFATTPPSVQQEAQGAVAWRDPAPHAAAPQPTPSTTLNVTTPPAPVDVRRLLDHLGELRCYYVESRDGIKGYERRERQFTDLIAEVDADIALLSAQPSADAGDAAIGKAYLRWYGAAKGYREIDVDAAHEAILHDAAIAAQPRTTP